MRILFIADTPERLLYDAFDPEQWRGRVDLVISCGDLEREYLELLVTALAVPLLYVPGNHDTAYGAQPPGGCDSIDGCLRTVGDLRVAGIGGSLDYNAGSEAYQYTEGQMRRRLWWLGRRIRRVGGVDIMVTHSAPYHADPRFDATDHAHRGCRTFRHFLDRYHPRYWVHGHNHLYDSRVPRLAYIGETEVINAYGHYLLDTAKPVPQVPIIAVPSSDPRLR